MKKILFVLLIFMYSICNALYIMKDDEFDKLRELTYKIQYQNDIKIEMLRLQSVIRERKYIDTKDTRSFEDELSILKGRIDLLESQLKGFMEIKK